MATDSPPSSPTNSLQNFIRQYVIDREKSQFHETKVQFQEIKTQLQENNAQLSNLIVTIQNLTTQLQTRTSAAVPSEPIFSTIKVNIPISPKTSPIPIPFHPPTVTNFITATTMPQLFSGVHSGDLHNHLPQPFPMSDGVHPLQDFLSQNPPPVLSIPHVPWQFPASTVGQTIPANFPLLTTPIRHSPDPSFSAPLPVSDYQRRPPPTASSIHEFRPPVLPHDEPDLQPLPLQKSDQPLSRDSSRRPRSRNHRATPPVAGHTKSATKRPAEPPPPPDQIGFVSDEPPIVGRLRQSANKPNLTVLQRFRDSRLQQPHLPFFPVDCDSDDSRSRCDLYLRPPPDPPPYMRHWEIAGHCDLYHLIGRRISVAPIPGVCCPVAAEKTHFFSVNANIYTTVYILYYIYCIHIHILYTKSKYNKKKSIEKK